MADVDQISATITGYLNALAADSASPQPTYSLDGENVSRDAWRDNLRRAVKELAELRQEFDPIEVRSQVL